MFDFGFSEILLILVLALIVLGPEKLPSVVRRAGRWVGRARAMARQFQDQLEEEIDGASRPPPLQPDPPVTVEPVAEAPPAESGVPTQVPGTGTPADTEHATSGSHESRG